DRPLGAYQTRQSTQFSYLPLLAVVTCFQEKVVTLLIQHQNALLFGFFHLGPACIFPSNQVIQTVRDILPHLKAMLSFCLLLQILTFLRRKSGKAHLQLSGFSAVLPNGIFFTRNLRGDNIVIREKPEHPILTEGSETKIGNGMATYVLFRLDCLRNFPLMHFVMQILVFKLHPSSLLPITQLPCLRSLASIAQTQYQPLLCEFYRNQSMHDNYPVMTALPLSKQPT